MFSKFARIARVAKPSKSLSRTLKGRTLVQGDTVVMQLAAASYFMGKASASTLADLRLKNNETNLNETNSNPVIENVQCGIDKMYLKVDWTDGTFSRYPYIFLRDNCKCPHCYESTSKQSFLQTIVDVGLNLEAEKANFSDDGQYLTCVWPGGHESKYHLEWLRDNRMPEKNELGTRLNTDSLVKDDLILWDAETMQDNIPSYDYEAVMNDDKSLFEYLNALYQYGLVLLDNGPAKADFLFELGARMGWTQRSYLGDIANVKVEESRSNVGSTDKGLYLHTDFPYLRTVPDILALHCIEQSSNGGKSIFTDGYYAVKQLKEHYPEAFKVLTTFPMRYYDEGVAEYGQYHFELLSPMINLNNKGRIECLLLEPAVMTVANRKSTTEEVLAFYEAYHQLSKIFYSNVVNVHLKPGQAVLVNNIRVLHGRTSFTAATFEEQVKVRRWIQTVFYEWDMVFSKLRVLQTNLGLKIPYIDTESNDIF